MPGEYAGSSNNEHSLFSGLTKEEIYDRADKTTSLSTLKGLQLMIVQRALFEDPDDFTDGAAIFIDQKIDMLEQKQLRDLIQQTHQTATIEAMELQFEE